MQYDPNRGWEYENHPNAELVRTKCYELIQNLSLDLEGRDCCLHDTRSSHLWVYRDVTPDGHDYFAGNYRGAPVGFLENYHVIIGGFSGAPAADVENLMLQFSQEVNELLGLFSRQMAAVAATAAQRLVHYCALLSRIFTKFLVIHPYANGNGHMARLVAWILLAKQGLNADFWSVADRPGTPRGVPLDECIYYFRQGDARPLMKYFLVGIGSGRPVVRDDLQDVLPAQ